MNTLGSKTIWWHNGPNHATSCKVANGENGWLWNNISTAGYEHIDYLEFGLVKSEYFHAIQLVIGPILIFYSWRIKR
jgi:hypothetical protein